MKQFVKRMLTALYVAQMKQIIKRHNPIIVAVVGSVGKTSTKFAIATILKEKYRVLVQEGNYNAPISVPFIFFGRSLPALYNPFGWLAAWWSGMRTVYGSFPYDIVVVELGTDKPGDIAEFKTILSPNIAVVTAVSDEHMEFFGSIDAVAKEELTIAEFSKTVVLNTDDIDVSFIEKYVNGDATLHGYGSMSDENSLNFTMDKNGSSVELRLGFGKEKVTFKTSLIALHSLKAVLAAATVAKLLDLSETEISDGAAKVTSPPGRMQILKGIKNSTIIDDSYNASPLAVEAALNTLYTIEASQHIALLGNMNELGGTSQSSHEKIGSLCNPRQLDLLVTLGKDANEYTAQVAKANGCQVITAQSPYEAGSIIAEKVKEGAVILVKGSQNGVFSEEAIKQLLADSSDVSKLVRQSDFWMKKKRSQFTDAT